VTFAKFAYFWAHVPDRFTSLEEVLDDWQDLISRWFWGKRLVKTALIALWSGLALYGGMHLYRIWKPRLVYLRHHYREVLASAKAMATPVPPLAVTVRPIDSHRLELTWPSSGPGYHYRVYWQSEDRKTRRAVGSDVLTPGARVGIGQMWGSGFIAVTAIGRLGDETPLSDLIPFTPEDVNQYDEVTAYDPALASAGQTAASTATEGASGGAAERAKNLHRATSSPAQTNLRSSAPSSGQVIPVPVELHASVTTPDLIRLSWRAVGLNYTYTAYSSTSAQLTSLRKENDRPLKSNLVDWTPETGQERYWVVVTAVDAQGRESAFSEAIEVVRHPEKSRNSGLLDEAAGAVKKVLPW
jgi:hypothetical protein